MRIDIAEEVRTLTMQGIKLNKDIYMLYFYEIKETEQGFIGDVPDLEMETIEFKTKEEVVDALNKGLSTFIEMAYRQNNKRIPLPTTREFKKGDHYLSFSLGLFRMFGTIRSRIIDYL